MDATVPKTQQPWPGAYSHKAKIFSPVASFSLPSLELGPYEMALQRLILCLNISPEAGDFPSKRLGTGICTRTAKHEIAFSEEGTCSVEFENNY